MCNSFFLGMDTLDAPHPANKRRLPVAGSMLVHRLRRWPNIKPTLGKLTLFACQPCRCAYISQQTQNICVAFIQRPPNVFDVGPTLYKCYTTVLCLMACFYTYPLCHGQCRPYLRNNIQQAVVLSRLYMYSLLKTTPKMCFIG